MHRLLFLFALLLASNAAAQDLRASDAPYIFYYSATLNGFVIERADGTDSRIIGQNVMEQPARNLTGHGWSPSGRWLAWRVIHPRPYTSDAGKGYLIGINGQKFDFLSKFQCIHMMLWHRTEDILLVRGKIDEPCEGASLQGVATYWLIEPNSQTILAGASIESNPDGSPGIYWFDEYIQFKETPWFADRFYLITMYYDGQVHISPITSEEFGTPIEGGEQDNRGTGLEMYNEERQFNLMYTESYVPLPFDPPINSSGASDITAYLWSEDENWLFVGYEVCYAGCGGVPGRVSIYNPSTDVYREISACGVNNLCVDWLPERVPINELTVGHAKSVLPAPIAYDWEDSWSAQGLPNPGISANVTHELRCSETYPHVNNQVVNRKSAVIEYVLPQAEPCKYFNEEPYFPEIVFTLSPDKQLYAITDRTGYTRLHDAITGERLVTLNFEGISLSFSDDSRTLYTRGRYASATWDIEAIVTPITMNNLPPAP